MDAVQRAEFTNRSKTKARLFILLNIPLASRSGCDRRDAQILSRNRHRHFSVEEPPTGESPAFFVKNFDV